MRNSLPIIAMLLALLLPLAALDAQQEGPPPIPPEAQEILVEMEQIQERLAPIQEEALADPEIRASQEAIGGEIRSAIAEVDPALPEQMERYAGLEEEMAAAQAEQDEARMAQIFMEAQQIEQRFQAAEAQVLQQPEIVEQVESFQARLLAKMTEIDPQAEQLIEQLTQLDSRLRAMVTRGT